VAAKRSPILGYNHNVRYRGIVFHVQTEDSGIGNPHVFSHLFHGGVILSTRKLVYDPDATEETVKSLMQAQHKAVMKDLKNAAFDEKIDLYLAGTAGLVPRAGSKSEVPGPDDTSPSERIEDEATPPAGPPPDREDRDEGTPDAWADSSEPVIELIEGGPTLPVPAPDMQARGMPGAVDGPMTRARTERVSGAADFEGMELPPPPSGHAPVASGRGRTDISEAMQAIQVGDDELAAAGLVEVQEVAQVHSPAPPSTPAPPGLQSERPGQYSVKRGSGPIDEYPATANRPPIPRPTPPGNKLPQPSRVPTPSPHTPIPALARPTPPAVPRLHPQARRSDPALPARPLAPPIPRPGTQPQRSRPPSGGVVVSRPPVIVGGPSKSVGTPAGQGKVRRAKDTDGGGIGGDLISERSLDEVILAYLSEDTSDE
jgi:hypothetical protein